MCESNNAGEGHDAKKAAAALSSVIWSALLTLLKFIVGIMTGSLGIISEALHSGLDLLAAGGTLFAVRMAARPADDDHPYGHGKIENLTALAETLLLLITAIWVINEAIQRLMSDEPDALHVETSIWAFVVVIISLLVDLNRAAMLKRVARETKSAALEADAAHFATDIWSSAAVLVGISGAALADMSVQGSWLHWFLQRADVLASLVVALLILHICKNLGMDAFNSLMDKTSAEASQKIRSLMEERMPAYPVSRLRVREVGNRSYVDMEVRAPKDLHVDTAHEITDAIEALIASEMAGAETLIHIRPMELEAETPEMLVRQIALTHRFGVHGLVLFHSEQGFVVFTDLELPPHAALDAWSVPIQAFRSEVARKIGADKVYVHVEPDIRFLPESPLEMPESKEWEQMLRKTMISMGAPLPQRIDTYCKERQRLCMVGILQEKGLSVCESHERLSALNKKLTAEMPPVARIVLFYV